METTSESGRVKNLQKMVGKTLEANGELSKIRASLRLQILNVLRGTEQSTSLTNFHENEWPHYNLIHEMIMEYFQWMKYNYSAEIFAAEIGHEKSKMVRNHLEEQLEAIFKRKVHMRKDVPMLLNLLFDNWPINWMTGRIRRRKKTLRWPFRPTRTSFFGTWIQFYFKKIPKSLQTQFHQSPAPTFWHSQEAFIVNTHTVRA